MMLGGQRPVGPTGRANQRGSPRAFGDSACDLLSQIVATPGHRRRRRAPLDRFSFYAQIAAVAVYVERDNRIGKSLAIVVQIKNRARESVAQDLGVMQSIRP